MLFWLLVAFASTFIAVTGGMFERARTRREAIRALLIGAAAQCWLVVVIAHKVYA